VTGHAVELASASRASDGGFLAAADMAAVAGELDADYRLVGGMAVTLLVAAHGAAGLAPDRETADADFGAPAQVVADPRLVEALLRRGYVLHGGNRFRRQGGGSLLLAIDVLAPSQDHRMRSNQEYGALYVDEVPGLRLALSRPGVSVEAKVSLMSGERLQIPLTLPDLVSAICMKAYACQDRAKATDALDLTVVGDALARTLEHLGHQVIRQNHIGDWGTPFGMLIEHLLDAGEASEEAQSLVDDPTAFYQAARAKFDADPVFAQRARSRVVALQSHDKDTLRVWQDLVDLSKAYFNTVYGRLGVTLTDADIKGESAYNKELAQICEQLEAAGIATVSEGALCVFVDGFTGRDGKPVPLIIRKSDGGYGYGTTDLATIRHRVRDLGADRVLYVIGAPQALHLEMVWAAARMAGWLPDSVEVVHVRIGSVLGEDGKILRTRSGSPLRLLAFLDEAVERAGQLLAQARPGLDQQARDVIAREVGIGAVKYADLSVSHDSDYTFDLDRMVSLTGNTGPYLQYAAARIRSILRKAAAESLPASDVKIAQEPERLLALALLAFGDVVAQVGDALEPHRLCGYLFELAQTFTAFYETCPVLRAADPDVRGSRLALCQVTLDVLHAGLRLLGIPAPQQM